MPRQNLKTAVALLPALAAGILLAGCQSHEYRPPAPESVLSGSTFVSVNALTVPAGVAEVLLQDASVVTEPALNPDYPYCRFRPGAARRGNETRTVVWYVLQGGPQNAGGRMGCAVPFSAPSRLFVTPAEVQGAVGGYFNLTAAP